MKCVLIGYGYWGKILEKYLKLSNFFELSGIYDPLFEKSVQIENILKDKSIECAFVCNPIDMHYSSVKELLENGKHIFCEKPLSKSLKETKELIELAKNKKLSLFTDYIYTSSPSINVIKNNINSLGKILYSEAYIKQFGKFYENDDVFDVLGVHVISALSYVLNSEIEIIDIISKKENTKGIIEIGSLEFKTKEFKGIINCSLLEEKKERRIIFICEHGNIIFDMLGDNTVSIVKHTNIDNVYNEEIIIKDTYDESNNLEIALQQFKKNIDNETFNEMITMNVAKALKIIKNLKKRKKKDV